MKKSNEHLQAQIVEFANTTIKEFSKDHRAIIENADTLAKIEDLNALPENLSPELKSIIEKYKDQYTSFLKQKTSREKIQSAEEYLKKYNDEFRPIVKNLVERYATEGKNMPEYIGSGSNGAGFKVTINGKAYCIKINKNTLQGNYELKALRQGKGTAHLAQLVAYSLEDKVTVMEFLPGKDVTKFEYGQEPEYTDEEICQLIQTVIDMADKKLKIDPKPSNFMYDKTHGFSILDYHQIGQGHFNLAENIAWLKGALSYKNYPEDTHPWGSEEYKNAAYPTLLTRKIHDLKASLKILELLEKNFPDLLVQLKQHFTAMRANPKYHNPKYEDADSIREYCNEYKNYDPDAETKIKEIEHILRRIEAFNI